ncbi:hypothetical protein CWB41_13935 [Methylovirgula ligni]|uniref:Transcription antitermination factor NusG n=2 Tax=Methylovirgula ligni TaxID=569860 RepID=A0A3D9YL37_9HYPH|nr:transcription termination/antitermination NusG family protein [Methylovirgula ligni]QAY96693.1 hypothetical protein CWB41_13935 [Methylovirgula ligni]REF83265.1 transcription antitermination factor NusG [Methylovirgula ligni]
MKPEPVKQIDRAEHADIYALYERATLAEVRRREIIAAERAPISWHLIYSVPQAERLAEEYLRRIGCEVFIPTWIFKRRLRKKEVERHVPLYRNYVFVGVTGQSFAEIEGCKGVLETVRIAGVPVAIPETIVGDLMLAVELRCFVMDYRTGWVKRVRPGTPAAAFERFRVGEWVKVIEGPFQGHQAQIVMAPKRDHVKVLMSIFGRENQTDMPLDALEPLS